ncbi:MAG: S9 family peptidase, partial [Bacteroidales bacterium]
MRKLKLLTVALIVAFNQSFAQELVRYQTPAKELLDLLDAPVTPSFSISPSKQVYLLAYLMDMPDLSELAQPELKVAGLRINPNNFGNSNPRSYSKFEFVDLKTKKITPLTGIPENAVVTAYRWAPD